MEGPPGRGAIFHDSEGNNAISSNAFSRALEDIVPADLYVMVRGHRLVFAALIAMLSLAAPAAAETFNYKVDIEVPEDLAAVLRDNLDIVSWAGREDVTEEQLRQLVKTAPDQIRSLLTTEGYFSPEATVRLDTGESGQIVKLIIEPGEPVRVVSIDFLVTGAIENAPDREQRIGAARAAFTLNEGKVFRQSEWSASKEGATHSLHRRLYAAARVTGSRAEIDPVTLEARLSVEIDSGPPFTFGDLQVTGLQRYQLSVVRNLSPIKPGDPYDEEQLRKYQKRLLASGRFASAVVFAANDPENAGATPIIVNLVESQSRKVELGVGFSTDRGLRGIVGYTDQNTFDRAMKLNARAEVDRLRQEVLGGLALPRKASGWNYGAVASFKHEDIQDLETTDWSVTGLHTYLVEEYESQQALQMITENRVLADGSEDNVQALYLAQIWSWNKLDDFLTPRSGYFLTFQVGGASRDVVSDANFGRIIAKGSYFLPVRDFGTVSLRLESGTVIADSRAGIPSEYLFRTGGDNSVRGYEFESLGVEQGGSIVGGRYLLVGSIEYIQWIRPQWGAAVFYDAGNAVDETSDFEAASGYGVGVRWYGPIGALNFDVAYGEDVDEYRVHFTAGFVFR